MAEVSIILTVIALYSPGITGLSPLPLHVSLWCILSSGSSLHILSESGFVQAHSSKPVTAAMLSSTSPPHTLALVDVSIASG